jgi:hypothetical protein
VRAPSVTVTTILEDRAPYVDEALLLWTSLERFGGRLAGAPRRAYVAGGCSAETERELRAAGADVRSVPPVIDEFRLANKLAMLAGEAGEGADMVLAVDVDTVVAGDLTPWLVPGLVQAKQPDGDLLPIDAWAEIFARFGLELPPERHPTSLAPDWTHAYFNTGVLVLPGPALRPLYDRWLFYVRALLEDDAAVAAAHEHVGGHVPERPGATTDDLTDLYYAEQWAFALARAELRLPYAVLPLALNFPLITRDDETPGAYIQERFLAHAIRPLVLHHHHRTEGGLRRTGYAGPDAVVDELNAALLERPRAAGAAAAAARRA